MIIRSEAVIRPTSPDCDRVVPTAVNPEAAVRPVT